MSFLYTDRNGVEFSLPTTINDDYDIFGEATTQGGMGLVLFGRPRDDDSVEVAIKVCLTKDEELVKRFKREIRILESMKDSSFSIPILKTNLTGNTPYFVMAKASYDISERATKYQTDIPRQERVIKKMVKCIKYLHDQEQLHRDIKPQNFLVYNGKVVISDFGLAKITNGTSLTRPSQAWGTEGYVPPDFYHPDGFRSATKEDDIYMLGKTMYVLLTGDSPAHVIIENVPPLLQHIIEKCCHYKREQTYRSCDELLNDLDAAYSAILKRHGEDTAYEVYIQKLSDGHELNENEWQIFLNDLVNQTEEEVRDFFRSISPNHLHKIFSLSKLKPYYSKIVVFYEQMGEFAYEDSWSFAFGEKFAGYCKIIFSSSVSVAEKVSVFDAAWTLATRWNRIAAANICYDIVYKLDNVQVGFAIANYIKSQNHVYLAQNLETKKIKDENVRAAVKEVLKAHKKNDDF